MVYLRPSENLSDYRNQVDELIVASAKMLKRINEYRHQGLHKTLFVIDLKDTSLLKLFFYRENFVPWGKFAFSIFREWRTMCVVVNGDVRIKMIIAFAKLLNFIDESVFNEDALKVVDDVNELTQWIHEEQLSERYGGPGNIELVEEGIWLRDQEKPAHINDYTPFWN